MSASAVRDLQNDLRALGYLRSAIDGIVGADTIQAIQALQFDLLYNDGRNGAAPVSMKSFNVRPGGGQYISQINGSIDANLLAVIAALMNDSRIGKIPRSEDPVADNRKGVAAIKAAASHHAPTPFLLAIVEQESNARHFREPSAGDSDSYVIVGLDRNDKANPDNITSRGYGIGQYTFSHHPISVQDVADFVADPVRNVQNAYEGLRDKFDHFVIGSDNASDRMAEHPTLPLRPCRYGASDPRYMSDCANCARETSKVNIVRGTPAYRGASISYQPTQYYPSAIYLNVPNRADFPCDWPYAARRYNGAGVNSYHYQTRVLLNLLR